MAMFMAGDSTLNGCSMRDKLDQTTRRSYLRYTGTAATIGITGIAGCAGGGGDWPSERIRLIIPFSEGGGTDTWHRNFIPAVSDELETEIQIDNVPGAASLRGAAEMVRAEGDGYTFGAFNPPSTPVSYMLNPQDWELTDLKGVCRYARQAYVMYTNPDTGFEDVQGVAEAYQNGDITNFGGQQKGGIVHVMANLIKNDEEYNMAWENYIGYDGGGPLVQAVASGEVPVGITTPASGVGAIADGRVNVVAVMASDGDPMVPDVPSVTDQGYPNIDFIGQLQRCQWAPAGTDDEYISGWGDAMEAALESDRFTQWAEESGNDGAVDFAGPEAANSALQDAFSTIPEKVDLERLREEAEQ